MKLVAIASLICLQSFFNSCSNLTQEDRLCYDTINASAKRMKKFDLCLIGRGVRIPSKINGLEAHYTLTGKFSIDEVRPIIVNAVEDMLYEVNSNEEIRPYLTNYPLTNENIEIIIGFRGNDTNQFIEPYISSVNNVNGRIFYNSKNPETGLPYTFYSETYSEALRIYRESCR